ncbi:putative pyridine nucleotide-disulphide oxidoreductase [Clostridium botulinum A3 str. Loch Maree]|nr:putative pyridine nucleotide-disulphide oxidoreductase [Clostridium botulinum A3 str. Loch Maree]
MAEVALCMEIRKKVTAKEIASLCGKTLEETTKLLLELAKAGRLPVRKLLKLLKEQKKMG